MTPAHPTSTLRAALCLFAVCVLTAPAAAGARDLRSPDARDAAQGRYLSAATPGAKDLQPPDARDAAQGRYLGEPGGRAHTLQPPHAAARPFTPASTGGFDWPSAAIGAVVFGGLVLVGYAASGILRRARTRASV